MTSVAHDAPEASEQDMQVVHAPTPKQLSYIRALQRQLHLPDRALDAWCREDRFGRTVAELERGQVSQLIDEMIGWDGVLPPVLVRRTGQQELPGLDGIR